MRDREGAYKRQQQEVVSRAMETAATYLPLLDAASGLVAELDVLVSFATAAALSPLPYTRPIVHAKGGGVLRFEAARHPCVELMEAMDFIPNHYDLQRDVSGFQIVTGPNMVPRKYINHSDSQAIFKYMYL